MVLKADRGYDSSVDHDGGPMMPFHDSITGRNTQHRGNSQPRCELMGWGCHGKWKVKLHRKGAVAPKRQVKARRPCN